MSNIINIDFGKIIIKGTIELCNINGTKIQFIEIKNQQDIRIDLATEPSGIYILNIKTDDKVYTSKVSKI